MTNSMRARIDISSTGYEDFLKALSFVLPTDGTAEGYAFDPAYGMLIYSKVPEPERHDGWQPIQKTSHGAHIQKFVCALRTLALAQITHEWVQKAPMGDPPDIDASTQVCERAWRIYNTMASLEDDEDVLVAVQPVWAVSYKEKK